MKPEKPLTHSAYAALVKPQQPCQREHITFGGVCLNCGYDPKRLTYRPVNPARDSAALRARVAEQSAAPLPMREDPRYRGTDFRSAIDVNRASQEGSK